MGSKKFTHVFDGFAKLYSWHFSDRRAGGEGGASTSSAAAPAASFSAKFVHSQFYDRSLSSDDIAAYLLFETTDPPYDVFERIEALLRGIDNTNTNVLQIQSKNDDDDGCCFLAVSDFWQSYKFDPLTLDSISRFDPDLPLNNIWSSLRLLPIPSTSHPVPENPDLSSYISFYSLLSPLPGLFGAGSSVNVIRMGGSSAVGERRDLVASIAMPRVPYMHSLGLSRNYAILFAHPLFIDFNRMLRTADASRSLSWEPDLGMDIYLVHLTDRTIIKVTTSTPDFITHHINAFEDETQHQQLVYVDIIAHPNPDVLKNFHIRDLLDPERRDAIKVENVIKRYTIDLRTKTVTVTTFDPSSRDLEFIHHLEMPVINERCRLSSYCFVYGTVVKSDGVHYANTTLVKKDLCGGGGGGEGDRAWYLANHYPSEPSFIGRPNATAEDDGVLLSVVLDGLRGQSYLAVFNATSLQLISRSYLPTVVPFSLHGRHFNTYGKETTPPPPSSNYSPYRGASYATFYRKETVIVP